MRVLVSKNDPMEGADAAVQRAARMALILSFSVLGIAGVYFGTLYLIAH
jgi:hypothetical protein